MTTLQTRFADLVHKHLPGFTSRNGRGVVLCLFHQEKTPSLSIDLEKCVFHCFGCGVSGGVKDFARLMGESWASTRNESSTAKARRARFQAEQQARVILQQRKDECEEALWAEWCEANTEAAGAAELLALFHRRPDLADEFPDLATKTEREYGQAVFQRSILEAQLNGELA